MIAGATAVGKSDVTLLLAERLGAEIISVDSMQVYRGLDIGTAKPSMEDRKRVPHHLIDVVELNESFDAAQFAARARRVCAEIQARGRIPLLCGGTGLYFKAFLEGLGEAPPPDAVLRAQLEGMPLAELLSKLEMRDPVSFQAIDRKNRRRVLRALEVCCLTGRPFSTQRAPWPKEPDHGARRRFFGLERSPADLQMRIDARVDRVFARGLVSETEQLLERGLEQNRTAMQAIGYRQVVEYLRGERSLPETIDLVKIRTRQFAKRQRTWFKHQAELHWLAISGEERPEQTAARLMALAASEGPCEKP